MNVELRGSVEKTLFQNNDNGFVIFNIQVKTDEFITAKGYIPNLQPGTEVLLSGNWIFHPKFGRQFEVAQCINVVPTSILGIKKYLGSGLIKGIGPKYAERLVNHFGQSVLEIIENEPDRLKEVGGIGQRRVEQIIESFKSQREISNVMIFLQERGISTSYATKIYKKYEQNSIAVMTENPYRIADEIWGVGFKTADQIALKMGIERNSVKRIKSGITFAITSEVGNGHLYVEVQELKDKSCMLLELEQTENAALLKLAMHQLYEEDKIKLLTHLDKHYVTLSKYYHSEKNVATKIQNLLSYHAADISQADQGNRFDMNAISQSLDNDTSGVELNEDQKAGILACMRNKVTIITGGPGTGKTTLIKKLLNTLDEQKVKYKLAAPTGRATKRMMESTGRFALTIHRLLEFDFKTMGFAHNEKNSLSLDFLIIDEASMIDIFLANSILKAIPLNAHLILIGDVDQLPAVGAGNFLNDLIQSNKITCIKLVQIFRQAKNSLIILNAHRINKGEFPTTFLPDTKKDFFFIKEEDPLKAIDHLKGIMAKTLAQFHILPSQAMTLVPMNKGIVGTQNLNIQLQSILNPPTEGPQVSNFGYTYKIGDRVMQIKNNYEKLVFNGDIGNVENINTEDKKLLIKYYEREIEYDFDELDEITLAYAISIHKSQGSEFQAVIIPIFTQHFALLQRNLIYTAITRAKKLCIFIGQVKAMAMAIKNNKSVKRKTFLKEFLTTDLVCR
ncbi:MAG: ATP-dependent RecD-like DNA helicase [Candidatus Babeliales bacterium]|nr:ATP-dependent RecD-like DNA helicase [Candidatus Babeliales bacterium]